MPVGLSWFTIIFTGFVPSALKELIAIVTELGGEVVPPELISTATHLVMPVLERTINMMCALSHVHHVLRADWIRESRKEKKWLGESIEQRKPLFICVARRDRYKTPPCNECDIFQIGLQFQTNRLFNLTMRLPSTSFSIPRW